MPTSPRGLLIGCDTGGTFTDFVMLDLEHPERGLVTAKLPSTPDDPSRAILEGIAKLAQGRPVEELCHATTVATNTLLEGTGGRVGYLVTEGFADSLWLGRGDRVDLYSLQPHRRQPPLRRSDVWEVKERAGATGEAVLSLEPEEVERLRLEIANHDGLQALSICLLHSTLFPDHESELGAALETHLPVFLSHQIAATPGEYERGMTTLLAASLAPKIDEYLARLERATMGSRLWIVHSAGGLLQPEEARRSPHRLALSGPAAGLRGALSLATSQGLESVITLDMGGTSTDVALCHQGELPYTWECEIEGYPLLAPSLEIHTIGAGGGSLAYRDAGGFLRVGPRSAGAVPGPACYGRGGAEPTVTDALCWAGYLPEKLGDLRLSRESSEAAMIGLAEALNLELDSTVLGALAVAVSHLALAVRKVTTGRGHDPQGMTLLPFGGAGPVLCCQVAEALEMRSILVPASAGVLSAWGALTAPWEREWSATLPRHCRTDATAVEQTLSRLKTQAVPPDSLPSFTLDPLVARRYRGQGDTLVSSPEVNFHQLHEERFGFARPGGEIETVEVRWRCRGPARDTMGGGASAPWERVGERRLLLESGWGEVPAFTGVLAVGERETGPFLHFGDGCTLFVAQGWSATGRPGGHLLLER